MVLLPIVERELRTTARKWTTYWGRLSLPALILCFFVVAWMSVDAYEPREAGQGLFQMGFWICFIYCALIGPRFTSDCISREKREGTLGLLFLTDLKGHDVVLGKLMSSSISALATVVAVLPLMFIPLLLGGVSYLICAKAAVTLVVTAVLSLSIGVIVSTFAKNERWTGGLTLLILLILGAVVPITYGILFDNYRRYGEMPMWLEYLRLPSPSYAAYLVSRESLSGLSSRLQWLSAIGTLLAISLTCLGISSFAVPRIWQEKTTRPRLWLQRALYWINCGTANFRRRWRARWLDVNPVAWLALRSWLKVFSMWSFLGLTLLAWLVVSLLAGRNIFTSGAAIFFFLLLQITAKLGMGTEAGLVFSRDLRSGAMELMLTTPMTVPEILRGQMAALRQLFFRPAVVVLALDLFLLVTTAALDRQLDSSERVSFVTAMLAGMVVFAADMYALAWTGMWSAVSARQASKAASDAIAKVLLPPWLCVYGAMAVLGMTNWLLRLNWEPKFGVFLAIWFVASLANDYFWVTQSRKNLLQDFRLMALQRYDPSRAHHFWETLGRTAAKIWAKY